VNAILKIVSSLAIAVPLTAYSVGASSEEVWQTLPETPPMPAASETGIAEVNGIKLYYAVYGSGEPLILLHGGLGHSDVWGNQIPVFAEKYQVIAVDSRGHATTSLSATT
jgi:hypothetical protein